MVQKNNQKLIGFTLGLIKPCFIVIHCQARYANKWWNVKQTRVKPVAAQQTLLWLSD